MLSITQSFLKKTPKPVLVFFSLFFLLIIVFVFWLFNKSPSAEDVFWQTIDNNLNSQSVILDTKVLVDLPQKKDLVVLDNQLSLSFAPDVGSSFRQQILTYDKTIAKHNNQESDTAESQAKTNHLNKQWYEQNSSSFNNSVYFKHSVYGQPEGENLIEGSELNLADQWYKQDIESLTASNFQHFLMASSSINGFLYGKLTAPQRAQIISDLAIAYQVDFDNTDSYWEDGRLFYQYEVEVDWQKFGIAFVNYFNANIADEEHRIEIDDINAQNIFANQRINYTVVIDVLSRQIVAIEYPHFLIFNIEAGAIFSYELGGGIFYVAPSHSSLMTSLIGSTNFDLKVRVKLLAQNQYLNLKPPEGAIEFDSEVGF